MNNTIWEKDYRHDTVFNSLPYDQRGAGEALPLIKMNLSFNIKLAEGYQSNSQIARILTENWVLNNSYCPSCGYLPLNEFENNRPVADFYSKNVQKNLN